MADGDRSSGGRDGSCRRRVHRYEWSTYDEPSNAVVEAVSQATGRSSTELPLLHDAVDTDALDALLATVSPEAAPFRVTFRYSGVCVTISADAIEVVRTQNRGESN